MQAALKLGGSLEHDGDELVRYSVSLANADFSASTSVWGNVGDHLTFAAALEGFPASASSVLRYRLGTAGTGCCELELFCTDALGHIGVWANIESTYPVGRSNEHETAKLFMRCDPAAIDNFIAGLRGFVAGSPNVAELSGLGA